MQWTYRLNPISEAARTALKIRVNLMNLNHQERQSWRDTMQVYLNGHVINPSSQKYP